MTITFDLSPELLVQLRERSRKQDTEAMRRLIADAATPAVEAMLREPVDDKIQRADGLTDEEFDTLLDEIADEGEGLDPLPEEAFTREFFYEDHPKL